MKPLLTAALVTLAGCAQTEPICDYDRPFDKIGTVEDTCPVTQRTPDDPERPTEPPTPKPPVEPPTQTPETGRKDNGLGNGDQAAPGGSLDNNKAENERGNPGHKSGNPQNSN